MGLRFNSEKHEYTFNGERLPSTTELLSKHGLTTDYSQVDYWVLEEAKEFGEKAHEELEMYVKGITKKENLSQLVREGVELLEQHNITPFLSEVRVHDKKIAGTIDLIAEQNGLNIIIDYKFVAQLNRVSTSWQTSIYRYLLEVDKGIDIHAVYVLWYEKPKQEYRLIELPIIPKETLNRLFECEALGLKYSEAANIALYNKETSLLVNNLLMERERAKDYITSIENEIKVFEKELMEQMEKYGVSKIDLDDFRVNYIRPTTSITTDWNKLVKDYEIDTKPYQVVRNRNGYIKTTRTGVKTHEEVKDEINWEKRTKKVNELRKRVRNNE